MTGGEGGSGGASCDDNCGTGGSGGVGLPGAGGAGGGAGGMGGGVGSGAVCGGFTGDECSGGEYCNFGNDQCGSNDGQGVCTLPPDACPRFYKPTCGCDGKVYGNACEAAVAGVDVASFGGCPPPAPGLFACGSGFCNQKTEYCQHTPSDTVEGPDSNACKPLPPGCTSCACIPKDCGAPIPGTCAPTPDGGLRLTCPGG
ncbi:hypothetical protein [Polyangium aurulentum]|uniref:hypothetical protein n=1 Tax=Polyangium aurulentum TaxID=2567896 RepID=UPI0010AE8900|nr:hypothetical protein [Polyangium aurulentum]UQA59520.1 hypothetical protein E8A73_003125 [Polyangium aurulentum]